MNSCRGVTLSTERNRLCPTTQGRRRRTVTLTLTIGVSIQTDSKAAGHREFVLISALAAIEPNSQIVEFHVRSKAPANGRSEPSIPGVRFIIVVTNTVDTDCTQVVDGDVDPSGLGGAVVTASIDGGNLLSVFGDIVELPPCFDGDRVSIAFGPRLGPADSIRIAAGEISTGLGPPVSVSAFTVDKVSRQTQLAEINVFENHLVLVEVE